MSATFNHKGPVVIGFIALHLEKNLCNIMDINHIVIYSTKQNLMVRGEVRKRNSYLSRKMYLTLSIKKNNSKYKRVFLSLTSMNQSMRNQSVGPIKLRTKSYFVQVMGSGSSDGAQAWEAEAKEPAGMPLVHRGKGHGMRFRSACPMPLVSSPNALVLCSTHKSIKSSHSSIFFCYT